MLDQLHTAPVTLPGGRHVRSVVSEVEGIMAAGIFAGVTVKTVQLFSSYNTDSMVWLLEDEFFLFTLKFSLRLFMGSIQNILLTHALINTKY